MLKFNVLRTVTGALVFSWIFFGEITSYFPFKQVAALPVPDSKTVPFAGRLNNELSDFPSTAVIDSVFQVFFNKREIKGASVSVTHNGHLIYAKGFGYADEESGINAQPYHLFRIASISKLVTAVAIMKLKETGRLDLNENVFGEHGILNDSMFLCYEDKDLESITVSHLLNHTAGWNHEITDPVFRVLYIKTKEKIPGDVTLDDIISFVLCNDLDYKPGSHYSYSNFGYAVLGKIIEKKSGMDYEEFVNFEIMQPLGIYDMHIGHSFLEDHLTNEVHYYDQEKTRFFQCFKGNGRIVPLQYGTYDLEILGSAGGWVASSPELIKLICAIDGLSGLNDILSEESIKEMTTGVQESSHLYGWRGSDKDGTWWRTGTLTGSVGLVMRFGNGFNWVVLLNTSPKNRATIHNEISRNIYEAMASVKQLPDIDLFRN